MVDNPHTLEAVEAIIASRQPTRAGLRSRLAPKRTPLSLQRAAIQYNVGKSAKPSPLEA
jgi:hypothetical protein